VPQFQIWGIGLKGCVGGLGLETWGSKFGVLCSGEGGEVGGYSQRYRALELE